MILTEFAYQVPATVEDAVAALAPAGARALAGGQGVLTAMKLGRIAPAALVDLGRIPELGGIRPVGDGGLRIGAAATLTELALFLADPAPAYRALFAAATAIADTQIRNRATVGGSLADRYSASDLAAVLLVLGGRLQVAGRTGRRTVSLADFYTPDGPLLTEAEIIVAVEVPAPEAGLRTAYERTTDRATLSPVAGVAVALAGDRARVAVTGATPWPRRLLEAETAPAAPGSTVDDVGPDARFRDDDVASAAYRAHLTRVLAGRALARAGARDA
ncbi:FAD binding domain-containing protein [Actinoplanes sp. NPDC051494]|uniref:FAD binding domain-containing protein n=1 Tax=Actinoplanes sp. NPDC051494 TaxID=3363907 RepID=UPI0037AEF422